MTTTKNPLSRVVGRTISKVPAAEAEAIVDNEIETSGFKENKDWEVPINEDEIGSNSYLVFGYDKINGKYFSTDGIEPPPNIFSDVFAACSFFYHLLFAFDQEISLDGYSNGALQVPGSKNKEHEAFVLSEKRKGIFNLMKDVLVNGYKPEHSVYIKMLVNKYSPVLHIDSCGYLADLAVYDDVVFSEYIDEYRDEAPGESPVFYKKLKKHYQSARTKNTQTSDLSEAVQKKLSIWLGNGMTKFSPDSLLMLQTAIIEFENAGRNPNYDYSGISMKLSKVFEKELKQKVFIEWRNEVIQTNDLNAYEYEGNEDFTLRVLVDWLNKKHKVDLGNMRYILERVRNKPDHPIFISLQKFIQKHPNNEFLLSDKLQSLATIISSRYRNGGVHDSMVTYDVCNEAFQKILIEKDSALNLLFANA